MDKSLFDVKTHINLLLKNALPNENLNNYNIEIVGSSEKGDGYLGDIYFVNLLPKSSNVKKHNLVLKCGKPSKALRSATPVKEAFENEIYLYNVVFPAFKQFQLDRNVQDIFDNYPKCYGTYTCPDMEVLVLENLKSKGYDLWDKTKPMPRQYIETVLKKYGQWHAISAAMQDQEPEKFEKIASNIQDIWTAFCVKTDFSKFFSTSLDECLELLKKELDENSYNEWKRFKDEIEDIVPKLRRYDKSLKVVIHGDCWNNNFMFRETESGRLRTTLIDWQVSEISSPIIDVSYYLYTCISEDDIEDFDNLLKLYHDSFSENLKILGSDPEKIYPFSKFWKDWKMIGRFGIMMAPSVSRVVLAEKEDIPDISKGAEDGIALSETFSANIKDKEGYISRVRPIVRHAIKRGIINQNKL